MWLKVRRALCVSPKQAFHFLLLCCPRGHRKLKERSAVFSLVGQRTDEKFTHSLTFSDEHHRACVGKWETNTSFSGLLERERGGTSWGKGAFRKILTFKVGSLCLEALEREIVYPVLQGFLAVLLNNWWLRNSSSPNSVMHMLYTLERNVYEISLRSPGGNL